MDVVCIFIAWVILVLIGCFVLLLFIEDGEYVAGIFVGSPFFLFSLFVSLIMGWILYSGYPASHRGIIKGVEYEVIDSYTSEKKEELLVILKWGDENNLQYRLFSMPKLPPERFILDRDGEYVELKEE